MDHRRALPRPARSSLPARSFRGDVRPADAAMSPLARAAVFGALAVGAGVALRAAARLSRRMPMAGRVCFVTGGSRGLGLCMARELVARGARVAVCARDAEELERARRDLASRGGEVMALACDVRDREQIEGAVREAEAALGPIDLLINNAGVIAVGPQATQTVGDYEELMAVHFWAALYAVGAVLPGMKARRCGRIVNISSIGGIVPVPHLLPYCASKFALTGLSEGLRAELLQHGIYVTTVHPGLMRTGSDLRAEFKGRHRAEYTLFSLTAANPLLSMNAEAAARKIVEAAEHGDAELILTVPAKLAARVHGLAPGLTTDLMALVNMLLPGPGGIGAARATGAESQTPVTRSVLTAHLRGAAERNNEVAPASS